MKTTLRAAICLASLFGAGRLLAENSVLRPYAFPEQTLGRPLSEAELLLMAGMGLLFLTIRNEW